MSYNDMEYNQRSNIHMDNKSILTEIPQLYIFTKKRYSIVIASLENQLSKREIKYQEIEDYNQLSKFIKNLKGKNLIIIQTQKEAKNDEESVFPKDYKFPAETENIKIYCYPKSIGKNGYPRAIEKTSDVVNLYYKLVGDPAQQNNKKIKLTSVHSIKGSKDAKVESIKSLKKITTLNSYDNLYYQQKVYDDQDTKHSAILYEQLIQSIKGTQNTFGFRKYKQLEDITKTPKNKYKHLLLTSTNEKSLNVLRNISKNRDIYDIVLLGDLRPEKGILDQNIALATTSIPELINFLEQNKFGSEKLTKFNKTYIVERNSLQSSGLRNTLNNLIKESSSQSQANPTFQNFEGGLIVNDQQRQIHHWAVDKQNPNSNQFQTIQIFSSQSKIKPDDDQSQGGKKKGIKKIKSPTKTRIKQQPLEDVNVAIISSPNIQTQKISNINRQVQNMHRVQLTQQTNSQKIAQNNNLNGAQFQFKTFSSNEVINSKKNTFYESKYKNNPSTIIYQMSDQYRGSNKQSIVNLEADSTKNAKNIINVNSQANTYINNQNVVNAPLEENYGKRIITAVSHNYPENSYIKSSEQIIQDPSSNSRIITSISNIQTKPATYSTITTQKLTIPSNNIYNASGNYNVSNGIRTYGGTGNSNYNSPTRIVRKEDLGEPEEVKNDSFQRSMDTNRVTFGNYQSPTSNYYNNVQNYSYQRQTNQPNKNIENSTFRINQGVIPSQPVQSIKTVQQIPLQRQAKIDEVEIQNRNNLNGNISPSKQEMKITRTIVNNSGLNLDDYERVELDDKRVIYRKKIKAEDVSKLPDVKKYNQNTTNIKQNINQGPQSPTVRRYQTSPYRQGEATEKNKYSYQGAVRTGYEQQKIPNQYQTSQPNKISDYQIKTISDYQPTNRINYQVYSAGDYKPVTISQNSRVPSYSTNQQYRPSPNYETYTIKYSNKTQETVYGDDQIMIQSSHKKNKGNDENIVGVTYRGVSNGGSNGISYSGSNAVSYGVSNGYSNGNSNASQPKGYTISSGQGVIQKYPRVEVQRVQRLEPRVQALSHNNRTPNNFANESNMFSRLSELHSDGSILRRNNIRFGINLYKKQKEQKHDHTVSVMQSKLGSGIFNVNDLNKKMALNRVINGEQFIEQEREKYLHINTKFNNFHFIVQEDLQYLSDFIRNHIATSNDRIEEFTGIQQLFERIRPDKIEDKYDVGFVFGRSEEMKKINVNLLPEDYYIVQIQREEEEGVLQINELNRRVNMDQLKHLSLAQKIIIDSKLYQYVAYCNKDREIQLIADKFMNSEFILQKIETQFTSGILDCYYAELPRLTRLYILCDEKELPELLKVVNAYQQLSPYFYRDTCKLLCVLSNNQILKNEKLIENNPKVTFISNPEKLKHYKQILAYAHYNQEDTCRYLPSSHLFYHEKHRELNKLIEKTFPGRFTLVPYSRVQQAQSKVQKINKKAGKSSEKNQHYLILHESVNNQKIRMDLFKKVYMLGKAKVVQNKVIRVISIQELLELLRK